MALVVCGLYLSLCTTGCVSNEYVIPRAELNRLSLLPPNQRGMRVQVVQKLGSRWDSAIENGEAVPEQAYADEFADYGQPGAAEAAEVGTRAAIDLLIDGGAPGYGRRGHGAGAWGGPGWRARPQVSRAASGAEPRGGGGLNLGNIGGGGGGGGGGDDLAIFASSWWPWRSWPQPGSRSPRGFATTVSCSFIRNNPST